MTVREFVEQLLVEEFGVSPERVDASATPEELGLDSFAMIEIIAELEREFAIDFAEGQIAFASLGEAIAQAEALIEGRA
jgi:acyl carrier protein